MTILFGIVSTILWLIPMPAINVYLKAETTSADITSKVVFKFDVVKCMTVPRSSLRIQKIMWHP